MENFNIIKGNLITLAQEGRFDVITHGCNCFSKMKSGIAPQMAEAFGCDKFDMEVNSKYQPADKLANIDYESKGNYGIHNRELIVVNSYTQYSYDARIKPLDYEALTICMRKLNLKFKGKKIGLPFIGMGLAGGKEEIIMPIIKRELVDLFVTMVKYEKK